MREPIRKALNHPQTAGDMIADVVDQWSDENRKLAERMEHVGTHLEGIDLSLKELVGFLRGIGAVFRRFGAVGIGGVVALTGASPTIAKAIIYAITGHAAQ